MEPGPKDRQRLEALQQRLAAAREEKRAWTEERRELRARVTSAERAAKRLERAEGDLARAREELEVLRRGQAEERRSREAAEARVVALTDTQAQLIEQNKSQAEQLEVLAGQLETLKQAAREALAARDTMVTDLRAAREELASVAETLKKLEATSTELRRALQVARAQLESSERPVMLPAEEVGGLVERLFANLRRGLPGLDVSDGELKLKLAFAAAGEERGFVVPTADAPGDVTTELHEVSFRFDRTSGSRQVL